MIWMNHELDRIMGRADVMAHIKSLRMEWIGHVARTDKSRNVNRTFEWKPLQ